MRQKQVHCLWAELGLLNRISPGAAITKEEEVFEPQAKEEEGKEEIHGGRQEQVGQFQQGLHCHPQPQGLPNLLQVQQRAVRQWQAAVSSHQGNLCLGPHQAGERVRPHLLPTPVKLHQVQREPLERDRPIRAKRKSPRTRKSARRTL